MLSMQDIVKRVKLSPPVGTKHADLEEKLHRYTVIASRMSSFAKHGERRYLFCAIVAKESKLYRMIAFSNNCKEFHKLDDLNQMATIGLKNMMTNGDEVRLLLNTEVKVDTKKKPHRFSDFVLLFERSPLKTIATNEGIFVSTSLRCSKFFYRRDQPVVTCCSYCHSSLPCQICPDGKANESIDCCFIATFTDDSSFEKGFIINLQSLSAMLNQTELSTANILATQPLDNIKELLDDEARYILIVNHYREKTVLEFICRDTL